MRCDVPCCNNGSKGKKTVKSQEITFHMFPKDPNICEAWVRSLGITAWKLQSVSVICSEHFKEEDFYVTSEGLQNIHSEALPIKMPELDAPAALRVCRICLAVDARMHDIMKFDQMFGQITGLLINDEGSARLPQCVCWECAARLTSAANLRAKALLSDGLLRELLKPDTHLKIRDIKSINRTHHDLKTNLIQEVFNSDHFDVRIEDSDLLMNDCIDMKDATEIYQDEEQKFEILQHEKIEINDDLYQKEYLRTLPNDNKDTKIKSEIFHNAVLGLEEIYLTKTDERNDNDMSFDESNHSDDEVYDTGKVERVKKFRTMNKDKICKENEESDDEKHQKDITLPGEERREVLRRKADDTVTKQSGRCRKIPVDTSLFTITLLTVEEQVEEVQKRRESEAYKKARYKCTFCYRGFMDKHGYAAHMVRHSEEKGAFECLICKTRMKSNKAIRDHMKRQHLEQYNCKECNLVTRHKSVARAHEQFHAGDTHVCPHCSREFIKRTTYLSHLRIKHTSNYVCEFCGFTFLNEKGVLAHKSKKHPLVDKTVPLQGPFCEVCNITFASQDACDVHYRLSSKHVENDSNLSHIRHEHRPPVDIQCNLSRKPRQPSQKSSIPCEQCGLVLRNFRAYASHFKYFHPGIIRTKHPKMTKRWMCEKCGQIFYAKEILESHQWMHTHGRKKYQCDHCKKYFSSKYVLIWHISIHGTTKEKFVCRICGRQFTAANNLKRHEFLHTGEKPYQCDLCERRYPDSDNLNQHKNHFHYKKPWPKKVKKKAKNSDRVED